jgi:predicted Zn finger-like uncharacterized protein
MILACSECSARYLLPDSAIGPEGREVRCVRCGNVWLAEGRAIDLLSPLPSLPPGRRIAFPAAMAPEPEPSWEPPTVAELRDAFWRMIGYTPAVFDTGFRPRRNPARMMNLMAIGAGVILLGASGAVLALDYKINQPIDSHQPLRMANAVVAPKASTPLQLSLISAPKSTVMANGSVLFAIAGRVRNPGVKRELVPDVVAELRDDSGKPIYSWTIRVPRNALLPGESVDFESSEVDVPSDAKSLGLDFLSRWPVRPGAWSAEPGAYDEQTPT